jgi:hypothetical protein
MAARKIPQGSDAVGAPALGAGVGMLYAEFVKNYHDESMRGVLIVLTPIVTVAASGLYFVYLTLIDLAIGKFIRERARKGYIIARSDPNSSPEHVLALKEIYEQSQTQDLRDLADSWREWKRRR